MVQDRSAVFPLLCGPGVGDGGLLNKALYCITSTNKLQVSSFLEEPKLVNSRLTKIKQVIIDYFRKDHI